MEDNERHAQTKTREREIRLDALWRRLSNKSQHLAILLENLPRRKAASAEGLKANTPDSSTWQSGEDRDREPGYVQYRTVPPYRSESFTGWRWWRRLDRGKAIGRSSFLSHLTTRTYIHPLSHYGTEQYLWYSTIQYCTGSPVQCTPVPIPAPKPLSTRQTQTRSLLLTGLPLPELLTVHSSVDRCLSSVCRLPAPVRTIDAVGKSGRSAEIEASADHIGRGVQSNSRRAPNSCVSHVESQAA